MADRFTYRSGPFMLRPAPIASGTVIAIGDLVKLSTSKIVRMTIAADNLFHAGVAAQAHYSTDGSGTINIYMPFPETLFEFPLDASTAITIFDALQWGGTQAVKKSGTDPIATAMESKLSATSILCAFRLPDNSTIRFKGDAS